MFFILVLSTFALADSAETYGVEQPSAAAPQIKTYTGNVPSSYEVLENALEHNSKHDNKEQSCLKLETYDDSDYATVKPKIRYFARGGRVYAEVSCPNDNQQYAILSQKQGRSVFFSSLITPIPNSVVLAYGQNPNIILPCHHGRFGFRGTLVDTSRVRRVSCVSITKTESNPIIL